jgi:hypothetical protein
MGAGTTGMTLNVAGLGSVPFSSVSRFPTNSPSQEYRNV